MTRLSYLSIINMGRLVKFVFFACEILLSCALPVYIQTDANNANHHERRLLAGEVNLESEIQQLKTDLGTLQTKFTQMTQCVSQRGIAFTVGLSAHKLTVATHQIIDFDNVITNYGNAFNAATSIFTAPTSGVYMFDVNIGVVHGDEDVEVVKNGNHLQRIYGYSDGHWEVSSAAVTTHLAQGDQVWVRAASYNGGLVGHELTSFSGVLVQPDCSLS